VGEAAFVLRAALGTLVVTETVYPHPLIDAEVHLEAARTLAESADRTEVPNDKLAAALEVERLSLERAESFGYGRTTTSGTFTTRSARSSAKRPTGAASRASSPASSIRCPA
jgi:hypothetical protein